MKHIHFIWSYNINSARARIRTSCAGLRPLSPASFAAH